jgi:apolipoprotein N-acyltransferase
LGNLLAKNTAFIQWYEYTGVLGGSLWILTSNIIFFKVLSDRRKIYLFLSCVVVLPVFASLIITRTEIIKPGMCVNAQVVHTTLKCESEKYTKSELELVNYHSNLIRDSYADSVQLVILPENAIILLNRSLDGVGNNPLLDTLASAVDTKKTAILTGAVVKAILPRNTYSPNSNYDERTQRDYLIYNSALFLKGNVAIPEVQVKNKLVPFNEYVPYAAYAELFGIGLQPDGLKSFSPSNARDVFDLIDVAKIGSPICYETLFGEYITAFVRKGASILVIILNEGWYNNHGIAERFLHYASLRAIETRRTVLRSSNQGYSSITDKRGNILATRTTQGSLMAKGKLGNGLTFYSIYGDLIGLASLITLALILIFNFNKH